MWEPGGQRWLVHLQVAAVPEDKSVEAVAADDADEVLWTPVQQLRAMQGSALLPRPRESLLYPCMHIPPHSQVTATCKH
jgi:hypothetical protein